MSLVNSLNIIEKSLKLFLWAAFCLPLSAVEIEYELQGPEAVLVKSLGHDAVKMDPGALLPVRSLVSSDKTAVKILRKDSETQLEMMPDSVIEQMGMDVLETPQWFLYRGEIMVSNAEPLLIKMGMAEVLLFPGKTQIVIEENHVFAKSIEGGLMLSTPSYVEGLKFGQEARVDQEGKIKVASGSSSPSTSVNHLEYRYHLLGLKYKEIATQRISQSEGLSFSDKANSKASILRLLNRHRWEQLLEKGREQLFVQELIGLENENEVLPVSMKKHFYDKEATTVLFEDMAKVDKKLKQLSEMERDEVVFMVRQKISEPLLSRFRIKDGFKINYCGVLSYNSNVAQNPDENPIPTNEGGVSLMNSLSVDYQGRQWEEGQTTAQFKILDLTYFDDDFENRQFTRLGSKLTHTFSLDSKAFISAISPSMALDLDYLQSSGSREFAFWTVKPAINFVFQPINEAFWGYSDLLLFFAKFGMDVRRYSVDKYSFGELKNSYTPNFTLLAIDYSKMGEYKNKSIFAFNMRLADSEAKEYKYETYRFDYIYSVSRGGFSLEPSIAYTYRDQDEYFGVPRKDDVFEYGVSLKKDYEKFYTDLSIGYRHVDRRSTRLLSSYEDDQITGEVHVRF